MVEKSGGVMDNQRSLKEQLDIAIQRRDVAGVKRILLISNSNKNKKHSKKHHSHQVLLALAQLIKKA